MLLQFINLRGKTASVGTAVGPCGGRSSGRCRAAGGSASFSERCSVRGSLNFLVDHKHFSWGDRPTSFIVKNKPEHSGTRESPRAPAVGRWRRYGSSPARGDPAGAE